MSLEVIVVWAFLLRAQVFGNLQITQIAMFTKQTTCEQVRMANLQHAVSPACFITQALTVREKLR